MKLMRATGKHQEEEKKLQKILAARIMTNSCYDADARPLPTAPGLNKIQYLIDNETNSMVFKALTGSSRRVFV